VDDTGYIRMFAEDILDFGGVKQVANDDWCMLNRCTMAFDEIIKDDDFVILALEFTDSVATNVTAAAGD
jgi:hypothetical protein